MPNNQTAAPDNGPQRGASDASAMLRTMREQEIREAEEALLAEQQRQELLAESAWLRAAESGGPMGSHYEDLYESRYGFYR